MTIETKHYLEQCGQVICVSLNCHCFIIISGCLGQKKFSHLICSTGVWCIFHTTATSKSFSCYLSSVSRTAPCNHQQDDCEGGVRLLCCWGEIHQCCREHYHRWSGDPREDGSLQRQAGQLCSRQYEFLSASLISAL